MNGPSSLLRIRNIAGRASTKVEAMSLPRRLPATRTKTRAPLLLNAAISSGRYRRRWSFVRTTHFLCPTAASQTRSSSSRLKWSSWISTAKPCSTRTLRSGSTPKDLSMKKTVPSGGFAADRFFDSTCLQSEIASKVSDRVTGLVPLVDC